jgi:hypothetical protein
VGGRREILRQELGRDGILDFHPGKGEKFPVGHLQANFGLIPREKTVFLYGSFGGDLNEGEARPEFGQERRRQNQAERDDQGDEASPGREEKDSSGGQEAAAVEKVAGGGGESAALAVSFF